MKKIFALTLSMSLSHVPALALTVNPDHVKQAQPHAHQLNTFEVARLTARKAVAQILLAEMRKSDWLMRVAGDGEGVSKRNLAVTLGYTASGTALVALLSQLARSEWKQAHGYAIEKEEVAVIRQKIADVAAVLRDGIPEAKQAEAIANEITEVTMREEIVGQQLLLKNALWDAKQAPIQRLGRGVVFTLVPLLAVALIADVSSVWFQIVFDPDQLAHARADLEQFVDEADLTLRENAAH